MDGQEPVPSGPPADGPLRSARINGLKALRNHPFRARACAAVWWLFGRVNINGRSRQFVLPPGFGPLDVCGFRMARNPPTINGECDAVTYSPQHKERQDLQN
jgi:hypothetical protein